VLSAFTEDVIAGIGGGAVRVRHIEIIANRLANVNTAGMREFT
jgi:flagellar basal body rod protein FlgG